MVILMVRTIFRIVVSFSMAGYIAYTAWDALTTEHYDYAVRAPIMAFVAGVLFGTSYLRGKDMKVTKAIRGTTIGASLSSAVSWFLSTESATNADLMVLSAIGVVGMVAAILYLFQKSETP